ncbi:MAG: tRNA (adenosine(37)-N6)-threonylcarbamoyltransferase complex ATPase subunit type 1 TsaE [bacterium]
MNTGVWLTQAPAETQGIAAALAAQLQSGDKLLLFGELGSGKTTFIQGVVAYFDRNIRVTSPSYSLIHSYPTTPPIFHIDLYRLSSSTQLDELGLDELFGTEGIVLIEWAERLGEALPQRCYQVALEIVSENGRRISIEEVSHVAGS